MKVVFHGGKANGKVNAPPSKSHTHRAMFIASLADGKSSITDPLMSDDTVSSMNILRSFGSEFKNGYRKLYINGGELRPPSEILNAGNSGTSARFTAATASLFDRYVEIDGDESLRKRPMAPLLETLGSMGAVHTSKNGTLPLKLKGPIHGGSVTVPGDMSSQFVSSVLIVSPLLDRNVKMNFTELVSRPYAEMTVSVMKEFGADVVPNKNGYEVKNSEYRPNDYIIPGDPSSAAYMLAAGAMSGKVSVRGLIPESGGDMAIAEILRMAGSSVTIKKDSVTAELHELRSVNIDMTDVPDLFPIVAVMLSVADGTSILRNVSRLRYKESNRVDATVELINKLGGNASVNGNDVIIYGVDVLTGGKISSHSDHRIAMAAGIASVVSNAAITVDDFEHFTASYPGYLEHMKRIGLEMDVI